MSASINSITLDTSNNSLQSSPTLITAPYFKKNILSQVLKYSKLNITQDNLAGEAILQIFQQKPSYQIWNIHDISDAHSKQALEKGKKLVLIGKLLHIRDFISCRKLKEITNKFDKGESISHKIEFLLIEHKTNKISQSNLIKLWNKCIEFNINDFWSKFIQNVPYYNNI